MQNLPKVSVIMPTYNRAGFVKDAIKSVLNQTFDDFELIIINDGSTDTTEKIIHKFSDPRIVYLKKKKNEGRSSARNIGISKARGGYISYLDDDDVYYPHHLKRLSDFLDTHLGIGLVYADVHFKKYGKIFVPYSFDYSKKHLEIDNIISGDASLMHRREVFDKAGYFDESLSFGEDWDMWLRISDVCGFFHLKDVVACVRFHAGNMTDTAKDPANAYMHIIRKRLIRKGRHLPFKGYYTAIAYRLVHKFKTDKDDCINYIKQLIDCTAAGHSFYKKPHRGTGFLSGIRFQSYPLIGGTSLNPRYP